MILSDLVDLNLQVGNDLSNEFLLYCLLDLIIGTDMECAMHVTE